MLHDVNCSRWFQNYAMLLFCLSNLCIRFQSSIGLEPSVVWLEGTSGTSNRTVAWWTQPSKTGIFIVFLFGIYEQLHTICRDVIFIHREVESAFVHSGCYRSIQFSQGCLNLCMSLYVLLIGYKRDENKELSVRIIM